MAIFTFLFVSCIGEDEDGTQDGSSYEKTCESTSECPIGYYCHPEKKICTNESGNSGDSSDSGSGDNGGNSGDSSDSGSGSDDSSDSGKQDGDDDPITGKCTPGKKQTCAYQGAPETEGVGPCKAAIRTCQDDGTWGKCEGGYEPVSEIGKELCSDGIDNDCDGEVDNGTDFDGDGFGACKDCCEVATDCKGFDPATVYPGAYEMIGDEIDNNCNGEIDESTSCDGEDSALAVGDYAGNAVKLAHAMGICGDQLVSAEISLAGEPVTENIANDTCCLTSLCSKSSRASRQLPYFENDYKTFAAEPKFGNNITPLEGSKIAILSTGPWDGPTKDDSCAKLSSGDMKTASKIPSDWINMMKDCAIPKAPSCGGSEITEELSNECSGKTIPDVQDPIMLTLKIKAPMNARAFQFNLFFFSVEYPSTVCDDRNYNDFFIALLDSEHNTKYPNDEFQNPYDKNLAKDGKGNPVGVDLAPNGLFMVCNPDDKSTSYSKNCTQGKTLLEGTGFDSFGSGGTGWLTTRGNVVPGETITLRLALWEQGSVRYGPDHSWDTTVLLDGFKWLPQPAKAGTDQY